MITRLSHVGIYVKDQNEALRFYTEKMGFEIRQDMTVGDYRWLTVGPKNQPDLAIVLNALKAEGPLDEESVKLVAQLQDSGHMSGGVLDTDDCRRDYEEMSAKGVEFVQTPQEQPWGIEAVLRDNSGNWFSMSQRHPMP